LSSTGEIWVTNPLERNPMAAFGDLIDHVIPVALGGATTLANLQLLCGACNREKGADL
jgi:5-methylcytosine-specific restriction endonuclease McrA